VGVGWRTRGTVDGRDLPILSLGMLGLAWSLHAAMSPDDMHLAPLLAPVGLLLAVLVATQPSRATIRRACGWAAIAVLVMHPVVMLRKLGDMHEAIWRDPTLLPFGGRARGIRADEGYVRALGATIAYVHARVPSGEPIFVGITPHGHRPGNTSILYFFIDRPIPTRYHELTLAWPRPGGQEEVARDLLERRVRYLVLETAIPPPDTTAPAPTDQALGVLDRSIAPRYREERQFGPFHIYAMRGD
jgi:hypothetical protein